MQGQLFDDETYVRNWLCLRSCKPKAKLRVVSVEEKPDVRNIDLECVTCGDRGRTSENLTLTRAIRP